MRTDALYNLIEPTVVDMGFELVGLEYLTEGKQAILRLYVDGDNGINIGEIQSISRQVASLLDAEEAIEQRYNLEVSSPGLDRVLFKPKHYQRFVGQKAKVKLKFADEKGRRKFVGLLQDASDEEISLQVEGEVFQFNYDDIEKSRLVPDFN